MSEIVTKQSNKLELTHCDLTRFRPPRSGELLHFEVGMSGRAEEGQFKTGVSQPTVPGYGAFAIKCDEGTSYFGNDSAPSPLGYLTAGVAFCLLSHLAMFRDAYELDIEEIRVELKMKFSGTASNKEMMEKGLLGFSDGMDVHVIVKSDEPDAMIDKMYTESVNACLALQTVRNPVEVSTSLHRG